MFNYHLLEVDHASSNDVNMKHLPSPKPRKRVAQKFHFALLQIEVTRALRGLSAIAELLVLYNYPAVDKISTDIACCMVIAALLVMTACNDWMLQEFISRFSVIFNRISRVSSYAAFHWTRKVVNSRLENRTGRVSTFHCRSCFISYLGTSEVEVEGKQMSHNSLTVTPCKGQRITSQNK